MTKNPDEFTLEEIQEKVQKLDGWDNEETKKIHKTFTFDNFVQALEFTNKVGEVAEEKQHHPDIHLTWGEVTIEIQTHQTGNLTDADFELAEQIDQIN